MYFGAGEEVPMKVFRVFMVLCAVLLCSCAAHRPIPLTYSKEECVCKFDGSQNEREHYTQRSGSFHHPWPREWYSHTRSYSQRYGCVCEKGKESEGNHSNPDGG